MRELSLAVVEAGRTAWAAAVPLAFVDAVPLGVLAVDDRSDRVLVCNHRFLRLWRLDQAPVRGSDALSHRDLMAACAVQLADGEGRGAEAARLRGEGELAVADEPFRLADGRLLRRVSVQLRDAAGGHLGRLSFFDEVSAPASTAEELRDRLEGEELTAQVSRALSLVNDRTFAERACEALGALGVATSAQIVRLIETDRLGRRPERDWSWHRASGPGSRDYPPLEPRDLSVYRAALQGVTALMDAAHPLPDDAVEERAFWAGRGIEALVNVPLFRGGVLSGFLTLEWETPGHVWPERDVRRAASCADAFSLALARRRDDEAMGLVSQCLLGFGADYEENLEVVAATLGSLFDPACVLVNVRAGEDLVTRAGWHLPYDLPRRDKAAGHVCTAVIERDEDELFVVEDLQLTSFAQSDPNVRRYGLRGYVSHPVSSSAGAVASLCAVFTEPVRLSAPDQEVFRILGRAASVECRRKEAEDDRLLGLAQLEQAMERTLLTVASAFEVRDPYTAGHERRVAELVEALARLLGWDREAIRLLKMAATVHDIGKIAVPVDILTKPSRLHAAEFELIKTHARAGYDLLSPGGLPDQLALPVLQHHERLDGSGYPDGLHGAEIDAGAKLLAVADVVEAMASDRPYRAAVGLDAALAEIERGRGLHYDARVVDACLRLFREQGFVFTT